jgi:hypothetical protein
MAPRWTEKQRSAWPWAHQIGETCRKSKPNRGVMAQPLRGHRKESRPHGSSEAGETRCEKAAEIDAIPTLEAA